MKRAPDVAATLPRGLVGFSEILAAEIFEFQRRAHPTRRADWIKPRWNWMFLASAYRLGVEPMVWLYRAKDGITAHQGAIPVKVQVGPDELMTGWFVETMVLEIARGRAVGPMLVAKAREDLPFNLSLGQTAQMRELQFSLGWTQLCPLPTYAYVLNPRALVVGKVPRAFEKPGALALAAKQRMRSRLLGRRSPATATVTDLDRFDQRHTELWQRLRPHFPCAVVRDASYLNWKYCEQPGQNFVRFEVICDGALEALVVFSVLDTDSSYRYRRAAAVELIASPERADVVTVALDVLCEKARDLRADLVVFDLLHARLEALLREYGFERRDSTRSFLVSTGGLAPTYVRAVNDPGRWLLTRGDSDIDRPW